MVNDRTYVIIKTSDLELVNFDEVLETSSNTVRKSDDGLKVILKWEGNTPNFISNITNIEGPYSHGDISSILETIDWSMNYITCNYDI